MAGKARAQSKSAASNPPYGGQAGKRLNGRERHDGHELNEGALDRGRPDGRGQVSEIQRARMLTAMMQEISERGAANVSVAHVVGRSGVSRRTFYEIFEDREDCFLAAFDDALEHVGTVVVAAYEGPGSWRARIRAALTALLECLDYDPATGRLLIVESLAAGPRALERRHRVLARIVAVLEEGQGESKAAGSAPPLTAEGIAGGVLSVLHARLTEVPSSSAARGVGATRSPSVRSTRSRSVGAGRSDGDSPARTPPGGVPEGGLLELLNPLMGMIVLPYLGTAAARKEIERPTPEHSGKRPMVRTDPLQDLPMRFTYRTMRVLMAVAERPGSSNRMVAQTAGIGDQGQASKLLARLHRLGLIENQGGDPARGEPKAWTLTATGRQVHDTIAGLEG
jgi:AcrR family transcriptional regulator/DNA-binding MarR family transcriptional regulator